MKTIRIVLDDESVVHYNMYYLLKHPRAKKKPIQSPIHPSLNSWMILKRPVMNSLKQRYKDYIVFMAEECGLSGMHIDHCEITLQYYFPTNRRHDCDNYTPKFYLDGLTAADVIADDDFTHVTSLHTYGHIDRENPRVEMIITCYGTEDVK